MAAIAMLCQHHFVGHCACLEFLARIPLCVTCVTGAILRSFKLEDFPVGTMVAATTGAVSVQLANRGRGSVFITAVGLREGRHTDDLSTLDITQSGLVTLGGMATSLVAARIIAEIPCPTVQLPANTAIQETAPTLSQVAMI